MAIFKNICNRWNFMILKMKIFRWFKSCLIFWLLLPWAEITFSVHHHIFHVNDINLHIKVKVMTQSVRLNFCCWFKCFDLTNNKENKLWVYNRMKWSFLHFSTQYVSEFTKENINTNVSIFFEKLNCKILSKRFYLP